MCHRDSCRSPTPGGPEGDLSSPEERTGSSVGTPGPRPPARIASICSRSVASSPIDTIALCLSTPSLLVSGQHITHRPSPPTPHPSPQGDRPTPCGTSGTALQRPSRYATQTRNQRPSQSGSHAGRHDHAPIHQRHSSHVPQPQMGAPMMPESPQYVLGRLHLVGP